MILFLIYTASMSHKTNTILVVEDERPLLEAIKIKLENSGLEVITARTMQQALSYLEEIDGIDGVWLDHYLLGKEDGLDLVAKIKGDGSLWKQLPVFVVSNTASADKVKAYMQFGIEKYFVKSDFRLDQIIQYMKDYLENGESK